MILSNQRIRLAIDTSQMGTLNDIITGNSPQFWNGVDLEFELALFYGSTLLSVANLDSITVDVKQSDPRTGLPVMSATLSSGSLNNALTLSAWQGGAPTDCHALVQFTNAETNLDLTDDSDTFWLVISALTNDSPAHKIVLGATPLTVVEGGEGVTPPASVVTPLYYTAAQSDARYTLSVDLSTINSEIATLNTEMTAVTATANAAMPQAGGTFTGAITLTGLSGVLKAGSGVVVGSATTSDLPEGSNLYYTSARFTAALAALTNVASGVCGLDTSALIPVARLPQAAIRRTFSCSSQAAMLALSALQGDIAIRTDLSACFVLTANPATTLGNWAQLLAPAGSVISVNSLTGAITLTTSNIAEGTNLYYTTARAKTDAIAAALTGFSNATGGNVTAGDTVLIALGRLENRCALNDAKLTGSDRVYRAGDTMTGALQFSGSTNPGVVLSNLTDTQRVALTPQTGMIIYDTTLSQILYYNGTWQTLSSGAGSSWFNGTGAPASTLGVNGAYYLDVATGNVYLKSSGSWAVIYSPSSGGSLTYGNVGFTSISGNTNLVSVAGGSATGTTGSAALTSDPNATDLSFRLKIVVSGSGISSGTLATVTFGHVFPNPPKVVFAASNGAAINQPVFVDSGSSTTSRILFVANTALSAGTYLFDFIVIG